MIAPKVASLASRDLTNQRSSQTAVCCLLAAAMRKGETRGGMATFLVILHGLLAVALLGSITHQAVAVVWPSRSKIGFANAYRAVSSRVYVNANIVLFIAVATIGGVVYPTYRVWIRTYLENARLFSAVGSFEVKEQFISIGLGLMPLYWLGCGRAQ